MNKIIITSILLMFFSILGKSQVAVSKIDRFTHLKQLKNGILLVQLPNRDKKIAKLKELDALKRAKKEAEEIKLIREGIFEGFDEHFDFCKALFFEREHTKEILQGNYKNVFDSKKVKVEDFPDVEQVYVAQYGIGHPMGEVSSYNGIGFQIRHIRNGELQTLKHDYFYKRSKAGIIMGIKKAVKRGIKNLNYKLKKVHVKNEKN